ncbi:MAG TPA: hypothetical protein VGM88_28845 [Kofleriaceae bacterium]|jgi:hypothetical protein
MRRRLLVLLIAAACGGGSDSPDAAAPDAASPDAPDAAGPTRSVYLANGGVQLLISGADIGLEIEPVELATDDDAIEIHQEFYGVPWQAFEAGTSPPAEWIAQMDRIRDFAQAIGKPVFLSITPLDGQRTHLADRTVISNGTVQSESWSAACYDFASAPDRDDVHAAYLAYIDWMLDEFHPTWLAHGVEVNLYFENCPNAVAGLQAALNDGYAEARAHQPGVIAFPTIQIDHLYGVADGSCASGNQSACFDANYAQISPLQRDRFAMSTYPMNGIDISQLPADWFTRGPARGGEVGLVSETGTNSVDTVIETDTDQCVQVLAATEASEAAYLSRVLGEHQLELVNWWSDRDLIVAPLMTDCPCTFDAAWCSVRDQFRGPPPTGSVDTQALGELSLKVFGTMGLRTYDGTPKTAPYAAWQAARQATFVAP